MAANASASASAARSTARFARPAQAVTRTNNMAFRFQRRNLAGGHPGYKEPTGYLWGEAPRASGKPRGMDELEAMWYAIFLYCGVAAVAVLPQKKQEELVFLLLSRL